MKWVLVIVLIFFGAPLPAMDIEKKVIQTLSTKQHFLNTFVCSKVFNNEIASDVIYSPLYVLFFKERYIYGKHVSKKDILKSFRPALQTLTLAHELRIACDAMQGVWKMDASEKVYELRYYSLFSLLKDCHPWHKASKKLQALLKSIIEMMFEIGISPEPSKTLTRVHSCSTTATSTLQLKDCYRERDEVFLKIFEQVMDAHAAQQIANLYFNKPGLQSLSTIYFEFR